jgi:S-phase kinase-associated protein 1
MSTMIAGIIDNNEDEDIENQDIELPKVSEGELKRVVEFCTHYQEEEAMIDINPNNGNINLDRESIPQEWYLEFIINLDSDERIALIQAANYLDIQPLLQLTAFGVSVLIRGKSQDEIREVFNITEPETSGN